MLSCNARLLTTHTPPAEDQTLNCYSSVPLGRASFADRSRNCIKHLHKADLKKDVLIVMLIVCHKNGKESSSECVVASCFKSL